MKTRWIVMMALLSALFCVSLAMVIGCQTASVHEAYRTAVPSQTPPPAGKGTPSPAPAEREVTRTVSATRVMTWAGSSPGETISRVKPMNVTDSGAAFGGMDPLEAAARTPVFLFWAGLAVAAAGAVVLIFIPGMKTTGLIVAGAGAAMVVASIAFESYPWLALVLAAVVVLAGLAWFIWGTAAGAKLKAAFQAVVAGVEQTKTTDPAAAKAVTANIGAAAAGAGMAATTRSLVNEVKPLVKE
ncbi:MAG TPA: hypothetical protein PKG77_22310 [Phycisphaerae bacterium]|nr:hypothetical protein [Phycisphaerae bacterium]HQL76410.1 hypothetical protein [Phycisphaerae bacterium]